MAQRIRIGVLHDGLEVATATRAEELHARLHHDHAMTRRRLARVESLAFHANAVLVTKRQMRQHISDRLHAFLVQRALHMRNDPRHLAQRAKQRRVGGDSRQFRHARTGAQSNHAAT